MVKFTNELLRSNLYRVIAPPGEQVGCTRYALVYFARAEDDVPLRRLTGSRGIIPEFREGEVKEGVSSKEHMRQMALGKRVDVEIGEDSYLPGRFVMAS